MTIDPTSTTTPPREPRRHAGRALALLAAVLLLFLPACGTLSNLLGGDSESPQAVIVSPSNNATVDTLPVTVAGTVSDNVGVTALAWRANGGSYQACGLSSQAFSCQVNGLTAGSNTVEVRASDAAGNTGSASVQIDFAPASTLMITDPGGDLATTHASRTLSGTLDDNGLTGVSYTVDGGLPQSCSVAGASFSCDVAFHAGANDIRVTASYAAALPESDQITVTYLDQAPSAGFDIQVVFFDESFSATQEQAFLDAATRWGEVITNDTLDVTNLDQAPSTLCAQGEPGFEGDIDDLLIFVSSFSDGAGGVLGYAGPCRSRVSAPADNGTNYVGVMYFDTMDMNSIEASGLLQSTILHEMGHVLGIGTNWEFQPYYDLVQFSGDDPECRFSTTFTVGPEYTGAGAKTAYAALGGSGNVPVEDTGGEGTKCGHWRESTFGSELMTGWLQDGQPNPLSKMTVHSLEDLGYTVDDTQADSYSLPAGPTTMAAGKALQMNEVLRRPDPTPLPTGEYLRLAP